MTAFDAESLKQMLLAAQSIRGATDPEKDPFAPMLCAAHPGMAATLAEFHELSRRSNREALRAAALRLETICAMAFAGLEGLSEIKNYHAAGAQFDLLVRGNRVHPLWESVCSFLKIKDPRDGILVEVKATRTPVDSAQVLRLGALIEHHFANTVGLGVLLCPKGATGHPTPGKRRKGLHDARLYQVLFRARLSIPIVVLNSSDLPSLIERGGLLRRLAWRTSELAELHGLAEPDVRNCIEADVPTHLDDVVSWCRDRQAADRDP